MSLVVTTGAGLHWVTYPELILCRDVGNWLVSQGHTVRCGNEQGCEQAFSAGANAVDPSKLTVVNFWPGAGVSDFDQFGWQLKGREFFNVLPPAAVVAGNVVLPYDDTASNLVGPYLGLWWNQAPGFPRELVRKSYARRYTCLMGPPAPALVVVAFPEVSTWQDPRDPFHRGSDQEVFEHIKAAEQANIPVVVIYTRDSAKAIAQLEEYLV